MAKILEPIDTGSNYPFADKMQKPNVQRSAPNLSHGMTTTIPKAGYVYPILVVPTLPGDDFEISVDNLIRVLPQVVPLMARQRLYIHGVFARETDLWEDGDVYMTKSPTGTLNLMKPVLNEELLGDYWDKPVAAGDLLHFLELPIGKSPKELSAIAPISALPLFMYFKAVLQLYWSKNPLYKNRVLNPYHLEDLRLSTDGKFISNKNTDSESPTVTFGAVLSRQWADDYFNSALPFPQRGSAPILQGSAKNGSVDFTDVFSKFQGSELSTFLDGNLNQGNVFLSALSRGPLVPGDPVPQFVYLGKDSSNVKTRDSSALASSARSLFTNIFNNASVKGDIDLGITLDDIRRLAIDQLELERMARTDGSFAAFGMTFFGVVSRNALDYEVTYFGGTYQGIQFSEVLQTSSSSNDSPLGTFAGHGVSRNNGYVGRIHCDEHGLIMLLCSIMPDTYYSQGLPKYLTRVRQEEEFLPGRDRKGMVPILNRELFVSGNASVDNDLFAYQDPFDDYRYRPNRICGKIADPENESFSAYTQARFFEDTPKYSHEFMLADDVRTDYLFAGSNEDAYIAQFYFNIKSLRPISFRADFAQIIN